MSTITRAPPAPMPFAERPSFSSVRTAARSASQSGWSPTVVSPPPLVPPPLGDDTPLPAPPPPPPPPSPSHRLGDRDRVRAELEERERRAQRRCKQRGAARREAVSREVEPREHRRARQRACERLKTCATYARDAHGIQFWFAPACRADDIHHICARRARDEERRKKKTPTREAVEQLARRLPRVVSRVVGAAAQVGLAS